MKSSPPTTVEPGPPTMLRAFRHRNYRLYFGGQLVSLVGTFLTQYATIWFVYRLTGRPWLLGVVGFWGQLPSFLLTPITGVWADRVNRRRLIVLTQVLSMFQSAGLAVVAYYFAGDVHFAVRCLIALAIFQGILNAFDIPARQAFLVEIVPDRADIPNAIALNSTMVHGARILGPMAAGFFIHFFGESLCFTIDAVSYIAVVGALLAMVVTPLPPRQRGGVGEEMVEGFRYVWQFKPIRVLLSFMAVISLTGMPAISILMPVFGKHFGGKHGSESFGILGSCSGLGAFAGAVYLATRKSVLGLGRLIAIAVMVLGFAVIAFSQSTHYWVCLAILPFAGWGMITGFAASNTIIQTLVEDSKRGRVMSFFAMAFLGMAPFGNLMAGKAADYLTPLNGDPIIGASRTILIAGIITVVATIFYWRTLPAMREIIRPIYIAKGILPEVAGGLAATDQIATAD